MSRAITLVSLCKSSRDERVLPLGCLWLRAALEARGMGIDLRDFQFLPADVFENPDALADALDDSHSTVGISVMADALPLAVALCKRLKERQPERLIILGGWGPSTVAPQLVDAFEWIDVVVRGEGERTLPDLMEALDSGGVEKIGNLDGRLSGTVFHTSDDQPIGDISVLPEPRLDDLDLQDYSYYTTVTARGCPHQCAFCEISSMEHRRVRNRNVDAVVDEIIRAHREYGVEYVGFQDDIFLLSQRRVDAIFEKLQREEVRVKWGGFARAGRVDQQWFASLAKKGLEQVTFGIEAGSNALLQVIAKGLTVEKALGGIADAIKEVAVRCFFLWGFPQETLPDFFGTAQAVFHAELLGAAVEVGQVVPLAGSPLYLDHSGGLELYESYPFCRIIQPPKNAELMELVRAHPDVFTAFYAFPTPDREEKWKLAHGICCRVA